MAKPSKDKIKAMKTFQLKKKACPEAGIEFENKEQAVKALIEHYHGGEDKKSKGGKVKGKSKGKGKKPPPKEDEISKGDDVAGLEVRLTKLEANLEALSTSVAKSFEEIESALAEDEGGSELSKDAEDDDDSDGDDEATESAKKALKAYIEDDELNITEEQIRKLKKPGIRALAVLLGLDPDELPAAPPKAKSFLVKKWKKANEDGDDGDEDDDDGGGDDAYATGPDEERAEKISPEDGLSKKFWKKEKNKGRSIYVHLADGAWQQATVKKCAESEEEKGEMCLQVEYDDGEAGEVFYFKPDADDDEMFYVAGFVADEE